MGIQAQQHRIALDPLVEPIDEPLEERQPADPFIDAHLRGGHRTSLRTFAAQSCEDGPSSSREGAMAESIYRVTEVIGTSTESWEDAAKHAVETAAATLRDLRVGEVVKLDVTIDDGHVTHYRARVAISFKYEHGN
jgi:flavin-binding protein dodecin